MPAEERSPSSRRTQEVVKDPEIGSMILEPPASVQKLQAALQAKAKEAPGYRFYLLYDKLYRKDVLEYAYRRCKANKGAPGVDRKDFASIEAYGEERWLGELADTLRKKTYRAEAVRRVWIPKADGKKLRPLGIPCVADRVVMTAAVVVLEPIFEVDMPAEQHAYRAHLSAHTAVRSVHSLVNTGHTQVIEGDLSGYFDSIPHAELLKSVARRVSDRHMLHLIKMWLDAPVEEDDGKGGKKRTTPNKDSGRGVPQGAPISPLLANLYMRRFVLGWKQRGLFLALTGAVLNGHDSLIAGFANNFLLDADRDAVFGALTALPWADDPGTNRRRLSKMLDSFTDRARPVLPASPLKQNFDTVELLLAGSGLKYVYRALVGYGGDDRWLRSAAETLAAGSPTTAHLIWELLHRSRGLSLRKVLELELVVAIQCCAHPDLAEGIRALIIDKDNSPRWTPPTLGEVTQPWVEAHFATPRGDSPPFGLLSTINVQY